MSNSFGSDDNNNNGTRKPSQYERRLARQRELDRMEAAASGTAPSMQLDMSFAAAAASSSMSDDSLRSRGGQTQQHLDGGFTSNPLSPPSMSTSSRNTASELFARPDSYNQRKASVSINLMDHDTAIYQERKSWSQRMSTGLNWTMQSLFGTSNNTNNMGVDFAGGDASAADDFAAGEGPTKHFSRGRLSPFTTKLQVLLRNKYFRYALTFVAVALVVTTSVAILKKPEEKVIYAKNNVRFDVIYNRIVEQGLSVIDTLHNASAPEYHALRWIAFSDPAKLMEDDAMLLERYALAVFFYASYLTFTRTAGVQKPIENGDLQWEGVPNPGWMRRDYWMSEKGHCQWYGIECKPNYAKDETNQEALEAHESVLHYNANAPIISIDLRNNHVYGTLPPEFKGLDELVFIDLSHNKLHGTFPQDIARMYELKHLLLNNNNLSGTLPKFLGQLQAAKELRLGHNRFSGTVPTEITRLWNLQHLSLETNNFSGHMPDLSQVPRLHTLWLDNNKFTGTIPAGFGGLQEMKELHLHNNSLTGQVPTTLGQLSFLEVFVADGNYLSGTLNSAMFDNMSHLKHLSLEHNQLTGTLPYHIGNLAKLQDVQLNNNQFTGVLPDWFHMGTIELLHLQFNQLDFTIPTSFGRMHQLRELWLHKNKFIRHIPSELGHCEKLESIYLENNLLTGTVPTELGNLNALRELQLDGNNFEGKVPISVCDLRTPPHQLIIFEVDCGTGQLECDCCTCSSNPSH